MLEYAVAAFMAVQARIPFAIAHGSAGYALLPVEGQAAMAKAGGFLAERVFRPAAIESAESVAVRVFRAAP